MATPVCLARILYFSMSSDVFCLISVLRSPQFHLPISNFYNFTLQLLIFLPTCDLTGGSPPWMQCSTLSFTSFFVSTFVSQFLLVSPFFQFNRTKLMCHSTLFSSIAIVVLFNLCYQFKCSNCCSTLLSSSVLFMNFNFFIKSSTDLNVTERCGPSFTVVLTIPD